MASCGDRQLCSFNVFLFYYCTAPVRDSVAEPFYIVPTRNSSALYESIHVAQIYEVPITSTSMESDLDSHHTYHVLEASKSPQHVGVETLQLSEQSEGSHEYHELEYNNSSNMTQMVRNSHIQALTTFYDLM